MVDICVPNFFCANVVTTEIKYLFFFQNSDYVFYFQQDKLIDLQPLFSGIFLMKDTF